MQLVPSIRCYVVISLRDGFPKKVAVLLDFFQMRGGGLPKLFVHFSQTVYWVNLGMGIGRGRGDPSPNLLAYWR